ncbi:MAG: hypothetical protein KF914_16775 [Rhizobiaceae bacterium]|nr:hypothetical protein [Rhizobiaceae bacterium]
MLPLHPLHRLAAIRGDGLDPRFLDLLAPSMPAGAVVDLAQRRGELHIQSGPHPARRPGSPLPPGVAAFPHREAPHRNSAAPLDPKSNIA